MNIETIRELAVFIDETYGDNDIMLGFAEGLMGEKLEDTEVDKDWTNKMIMDYLADNLEEIQASEDEFIHEYSQIMEFLVLHTRLKSSRYDCRRRMSKIEALIKNLDDTYVIHLDSELHRHLSDMGSMQHQENLSNAYSEIEKITNNCNQIDKLKNISTLEDARIAVNSLDHLVKYIDSMSNWIRCLTASYNGEKYSASNDIRITNSINSCRSTPISFIAENYSKVVRNSIMHGSYYPRRTEDNWVFESNKDKLSLEYSDVGDITFRTFGDVYCINHSKNIVTVENLSRRCHETLDF